MSARSTSPKETFQDPPLDVLQLPIPAFADILERLDGEDIRNLCTQSKAFNQKCDQVFQLRQYAYLKTKSRLIFIYIALEITSYKHDLIVARTKDELLDKLKKVRGRIPSITLKKKLDKMKHQCTFSFKPTEKWKFYKFLL